MLADSNTWRFTLARLLTDPVWYFFLFWFPKYLISEHSMSLIRVGEFAWVVYLAAGAGTIIRRLGLRGCSSNEACRSWLRAGELC